MSARHDATADRSANTVVVQKKRMPRRGVLHTIQNGSSSTATISAEQSTRPQADGHWVDGKAGQEPAYVKKAMGEKHMRNSVARVAPASVAARARVGSLLPRAGAGRPPPGRTHRTRRRPAVAWAHEIPSSPQHFRAESR